MAETNLGKGIGKLGFGFMRLPMKDGAVDYEPMKQMVDAFLAAGFTYFDTAYAYTGSEEALRETLVKRHPREKFSITTKMPTFMINKPQDMSAAFETSLQRLGGLRRLLSDACPQPTHERKAGEPWRLGVSEEAEGRRVDPALRLFPA